MSTLFIALVWLGSLFTVTPGHSGPDAFLMASLIESGEGSAYEITYEFADSIVNDFVGLDRGSEFGYTVRDSFMGGR